MQTEALPMVEAPALAVREVSKVFGRLPRAVVALDSISLDVAPGEFVCVVGASGCGKTTLLNLIAGLDQPTSGSVDVGSHRTALMFQEAALFPWLTAAGNVELALRLRGIPRRERGRQAVELLERVHLKGIGSRRPHELSGGMRQRVALARAPLAEGPAASAPLLELRAEDHAAWPERGEVRLFAS